MSELVEKVHCAVSNYCTHSGPPIQGRPCGMCDAITLAAIAAVAEWLIEEFSYQAEMIEIKQAMVAELKRTQK